MRRLALFLVLAAACRQARPGGALSGADSPRSAVDKYLAAAKAQDMQALSVVWGDEKGPTRDRIPRPQLEQLEVIQLCLARHDEARVSSPSATLGGRQTFQVELTQGQLSANVRFTVAKGPSDRWYVANLDTELLQNKGFCKRAS